MDRYKVVTIKGRERAVHYIEDTKTNKSLLVSDLRMSNYVYPIFYAAP